MPTLKNSDNIKKYSEKKNYSQPQLKEIGRVKKTTKGALGELGLDNSFPFLGDS